MRDSDQQLVDVVLRRADADESLDEETRMLILAALESEDSLRDAIGAERTAERPESSDLSDAMQDREPVGAFIDEISVAGFRGIGNRAVLDLYPAPGLTVVSGRNGSGKSSFSEAFEYAISGSSYRWRNKKNAKVWTRSWRNLHRPVPCELRVRLAVEDQGAVTIGVDWAGDSLDDSSVWVQRRGEKRIPGVESLGWQAAVELYRPILSYDELGGLFEEGPSVLYDALAKLLGLEQIADAENRLGTELRFRKQARTDATAAARNLKSALAGSDDERAALALKQISRSGDLVTVTKLATGSNTGGSDGVLNQLRAIAALTIPPRDVIEARVAAVRSAVAALAEQSDAVVGAVQQRQTILMAALQYHSSHGDGPCPVCGEGQLTGEWHSRIETELASEKERITEYHDRKQRVAAAQRDLITVVNSVGAVRSVADVALETLGAFEQAQKSWRNGPDDAAALATHVEQSHAALEEASAVLKTEAENELGQREDEWAPLATDLMAWVKLEKQARASDPVVKLIDNARTWVKNNAATLRNERLAPIAEKSAHIWGVLRQESNVELGSVTLTGSGTQRRVELEAQVDGAPAGALGVMSQGELHALSLALFLPRAASPASPFRFIVLDDPIQAMDPSKVEGFVRVVEELAQTRQVIVFSHDDRLASAIRQLGVTARVVEVARGSQSSVAVTNAQSPALRFVSDARALAKDPDVPEDVKRRVLPGLCRLAIEAAARDVFYTRQHQAGAARETSEAEWSDARSVPAALALALKGDRDADISGWRSAKPWRSKSMGIAGGGVHRGMFGDPADAVADLQRTVDDVLSA
ncbi:AAA family ATPase [Hoyosella rhizosphaerae]|uniref:Nuclease SbcCD subunit C n=1 Tax=Hoyosella rhizosphaerae TaxID=1755582 RepID=A0A916X835_9ACTN|nr:AAA family ATPase [Hoyosella rhizosphaerae]MBN4927151.1 AAA family ATPase [Hoyosella rhizosphaerae]GGC53587.1 hypothetical protein GCM10011410_02460 [Hoyosella rhizosphaerae]